MSEELKPCPFCGGEAYFERMGTSRQSCIVECGRCGVRHESSDEYGRSGQSWNERQPTRAPQAVPALTGWKLVPLEPSVRMLAQICNLSRSPSMRYTAMLAAAPQPSPEKPAPELKAIKAALRDAANTGTGMYRVGDDGIVTHIPIESTYPKYQD